VEAAARLAHKPPALDGPSQEQDSAVAGCHVGLTPRETTNAEFFKQTETTSQVELKKKARAD